MRYKRGLSCVIAIVLSVASLTPVYASEETNISESSISSKKAVIMYEKEDTAKVDSFIENKDYSIIEETGFTEEASDSNNSFQYDIALVSSKDDETETMINSLKKCEDIIFVEPDYAMDCYNREYDDSNKIDSETSFFDSVSINLASTDNSISKDTVDSDQVVVAVLDSGVNYNNENLKNIMWNNPYDYENFGLYGYDFINNDTDPMDDYGHGTQVSSVIASNIEKYGDKANDNIKIMALKMTNSSGNGSTFAAIEAYAYIYKYQKLGVNIAAVNASWVKVDSTYSDILKTMINLVGEAGAITVSAAGNQGQNNDLSPAYPASYDSPYIISVAATNDSGNLYNLSNYGEKSVDIAAPGTNILADNINPVYNPSLYGGDTRSQIYHSFDNTYLYDINASAATAQTSEVKQIADYNILTYMVNASENSESELSIDNNEYFGDKDSAGSSLNWQISSEDQASQYALVIPYNVSSSDSPVYESLASKITADNRVEAYSMFMLDMDYSTFANSSGSITQAMLLNNLVGYKIYGSTGDEWEVDHRKLADSFEADTTRVLVIMMSVTGTGTLNFYMDDWGVSASNADESDFGYSEYVNGTSFAAPKVTAAVALMASLYPDKTAEEIKTNILLNSSKNASLEGKIQSQASVDLTKLSNQSTDANLSVADLYVKKDQSGKKLVYINGNGLSQSNIYINQNKVTPVIVDKNAVKIVTDIPADSKGNYNIKIKNNADEIDETVNISDSKPYNFVGQAQTLVEGGNAVSDGKNIYYVNELGQIFILSPDSEGGISTSFNDCIFTNLRIDGKALSAIRIASDAIAVDEKLYVELRANGTKYLLESDGGSDWKIVMELPEEISKLYGETLAEYNGKIIILGGFSVDSGTYTESLATYCLATDTLAISKLADMTEARAYAKAIQYRDKLVITLGTAHISQGGCASCMPSNLIFDGEKWTESAVKYDFGNSANSEFKMVEGNPFYYVTGQIGICSEGVVYAGISEFNENSDTFIYNPDTDKYKEMDISFEVTDTSEKIFAASSIDGEMYALTFGAGLTDKSYENVKNDSGDVTDSLMGDMYSYDISVYSFDIPYEKKITDNNNSTKAKIKKIKSIKPVIRKLSQKKKRISIKTGKSKIIKYWEISYSKNKNFKGKTVKRIRYSNSILMATKKKIKGRVYLRIRGFIKIKGKRIYTKYSKVKSVVMR